MLSHPQIISLSKVSGVGPRRIRSILRQFPDVEDIKQLNQKDLCQVDRISVDIANNILKIDQSFGQKAIDNIQKMGGRYITYRDDNYPDLLGTVYDAPIGLFVLGEFPTTAALAVVGTRKLTAYGKNITKYLTAEIVKAGLVTVSGFARGIDTICHSTTIEQGGKTVAVLGCGIDICYPAENRALRERLIESGTIISEFTPGTRPDAINFPRRNRVISGLSRGTLVIEAGKKSGALITAYNALDQNREVFAVPGSIKSKVSIGCHSLIQKGAKLVTSIEDILEELNLSTAPKQIELLPDLNPAEQTVYELLSNEPIQIDDLCHKLGKDTPEVLSTLLMLELKNIVQQMPGKLFIRA